MVTPSDTARAAETYLRDVHNRLAGKYLQSQSIGDLNSAGTNSYLTIADRVADARRVLDLGCADGGLLALLAERGAESVAGVDLSDAELAKARARPELAAADLRIGRAQDLPWPDGSFDAVISHMALMLMVDVDDVAASVARVLAPGGTLSVGVGGGVIEGADGAWELFVGIVRARNAALPEERRRTPGLGDKRTRTREGLDEILTPHGFGPVSWDPVPMDWRRTPEDTWKWLSGLYGMEFFDEAELDEMRAEYVATAASRVDADGRLSFGYVVNVATTTLGP